MIDFGKKTVILEQLFFFGCQNNVRNLTKAVRGSPFPEIQNRPDDNQLGNGSIFGEKLA